MNSKAPSSFCASVEQIPGLVTVLREWRWRLADDWQWAEQMLRPTEQIARHFPDFEDPESGGYRIVWEDEEADRYIGYCEHREKRIGLCRADLIIYELDRRALASHIAAALDLVSDFGEVVEVPQTIRIGLLSPLTNGEISVYMLLSPDAGVLPRAMTGLAAHDPGAFILFTPTRQYWRTLPGRQRGRVLALEDEFLVSDGKWISAPRCALVSNVLASSGTSSRPHSTPDDSDQYVPDRDEAVVLRVLAKARHAMVLVEIEEATIVEGRKLSRKTVRKVLKRLVSRGLVDYSSETHTGARITSAGRRLVE